MISSPSASLSASQYPSSRAAFSIVVVIFTTSSGLRIVVNLVPTIGTSSLFTGKDIFGSYFLRICVVLSTLSGKQVKVI